MYQNAGEKGRPHLDEADPPRRRANKRRGHGNWETDRPPVVGVIGRESGQVALAVRPNSSQAALQPVVEAATAAEATVNTDEWRSYNWLKLTRRTHQTVCHTPTEPEWARDDDGDGLREVHTNTIEGFWTGLRNFLRPFRGLSKHYLWQYVAVYAWGHNFKTLTIELVRSLVVLSTSKTT